MVDQYLDRVSKRFSRSKDRKSADNFIRQLSVLMDADFSLYKSLNLINNQRSVSYSKNFIRILQQIIHDLHTGTSFNESLAKNRDCFSPVVVTLIKVGEESGNLKKVLNELTHYLNRREKYAKKIRSAFMYPSMVMVVALLTVVFMMVFLLPTFSEMFRDFGMELPAFTQTLMSISSFFTHFGWTLIIAVYLFYLLVKRIMAGNFIQQRLFQWLPRVPAVGKIIIQSQLQLFSSIIATLLENGVTMLDALTICQQVTDGRVVKGYFGFVIRKFKEGESLSNAMKLFTILPDETAHLVAMGEESAKLPLVFRRIDESTGKEIELFLDGLTSILEPLIMVVMGLIVGVILIGMYLPIFEMSTSLF